MGSIRLLVGFVACMTAMSVVSSAQSRLFVFGGAGGAEVSLDTGVIRAVASHDVLGPEVVDGGRYLAALVALPAELPILRYGLRILSPRTGDAFTAVEFTAVKSTGEIVDGGPRLVGDTNHARVFVWNVDRITSVSMSGVEDIVSNVTPPTSGILGRNRIRMMAYAPVAEVLFVVRQAAEIELAQYSTDGTLLRVIPLPAVPGYVAATSDGRRIFTVTNSSGSLATLTSYDALTGAEEGSVDLLPTEGFGTGVRGLLLDEAGERVLIPRAGTRYIVEVRSFDLALLQNIRYPRNQTLCRFDIGVDEQRGAAAVASTESSGARFGAANPHVSLVNLATGTVIASAPLTNPLLDAGNLCSGGSVVLTPPPAPSLQPPVVARGAVTLGWSAVRTGTNYQIEAGPEPGVTAFTARTNGSLSMTIDAVPPGTYYVRLRALNDSGASAPSPEIVVTVP